MDQSLLLGMATGTLVILAAAAISPAEPKLNSSARRHQLKLHKGRSIAYYTFGESPENEHPILYLHGFPGTGMEPVPYGCSQHAPNQIFGIDRPGMGYTSAQEDDKQDPFHTCCNDVWALAEHLKWERFSVIGLSGGGPHALALLASYLSSSTNRPRIVRMAFVGGLCMSGGTEGMMAGNKGASEMVKKYPISFVARLILRLVYTTITSVLPLLPDFVVHKILQSDVDVPKIDQTVVAQNVEGLTKLGRIGLRQGAPGVLADLRRCFGVHLGVEAIVRDCYAAGESKDQNLPEIHIHHGKLDVNVPFCHAQYMHEELFHKKSNLIPFDQHGHFSLIVQESKTYVQSVQ